MSDGPRATEAWHPGPSIYYGPDGKGVRPRGVDQAKVLQVVETMALLGRGVEGDPVRMLRQYWDFDGKLLAQSDEWYPKPEPVDA